MKQLRLSSIQLPKVACNIYMYSAQLQGVLILFGMKYYPLTMLFVFLGSMDCFTTVIGTKYFGTQELNPLIANLVHTNLPLFVVVKIAVSLLVALIFLLAEKILIQNVYGHTKAFSSAHKMLRFTYLGINLFLAMVVINNILVLINALL